MKGKRFIRLFVLFAAIIQMGCASDRLKPPGASPHVPVIAPTSNRKPVELEVILKAARQPTFPAPSDARSLFDGKSLTGWRVTDFDSSGAAELREGLMLLRRGNPLTGVNYTNELPRMNYEISLDAMPVSGNDFFCGLTFPVGNSFCSFIVGGWGGSIVGLSSLDGADASENETTQYMSFENARWYRIRLRVTEHKIEAWIEQKQVINVVTIGRKISLRAGDIERSKPFGLATYETTSAFREIHIRSVTGPVNKSEY